MARQSRRFLEWWSSDLGDKTKRMEYELTWYSGIDLLLVRCSEPTDDDVGIEGQHYFSVPHSQALPAMSDRE